MAYISARLKAKIDEINEGDKVSYDVEETPKGMNAINVKVV